MNTFDLYKQRELNFKKMASGIAVCAFMSDDSANCDDCQYSGEGHCISRLKSDICVLADRIRYIESAKTFAGAKSNWERMCAAIERALELEEDEDGVTCMFDENMQLVMDAIRCPYRADDARGACHGTVKGKANADLCVKCKLRWLGSACDIWF